MVVPPAVVKELDHERTPDLVRRWLSRKPEWLHVQGPRQPLSSVREVLGPGEREAIAIAAELSADLLLMDDRDGRREAERRNLAVLGSLRVLADAARHGFADFPVALDRLRRTNVRASEELLQRVLDYEMRLRRP